VAFPENVKVSALAGVKAANENRPLITRTAALRFFIFLTPLLIAAVSAGDQSTAVPPTNVVLKMTNKG
jgi:hypothetical protein